MLNKEPDCCTRLFVKHIQSVRAGRQHKLYPTQRTPMPYRFKKGGALEETGAKDISLPLSKENLISLLANLVEGNATYSHQDFANWCSKHFGYIVVNDLELEAAGIDEATYEVLKDVDAQWDLYLVSTYKIEELQAIDLNQVRLPKEWFQDWLNQLH
ncbi:hypothetical protein [Hymenobacter sp. BT491]|uniref:hypothetical protein n=1 Tax=Hymenobacter sp. BT491 TaxID=2766779 RepID=UPI00165354DC|nr:hypothetical protein [Hymenobacter sp. BT491]MBC6991327.1 hypothetical protein [Hymenobacter sp. BT491]